MGNPDFKVHVSEGVKLKDPSLEAKEPESFANSPFDLKLKSSYLTKQFLQQLAQKEVLEPSTITSEKGYTKSDSGNSEKLGVKNMEITPKDYTDQRIESLEKSIDQRFDSNEKLISEKIDHLHTRFESTLETKLSALKNSIAAEQTTQTQNNRSNMIGIIGVATAVIIGGTTILLAGISIAIAIYL